MRGGHNAPGEGARRGRGVPAGACMTFIPGVNVGPYRIVEQAERSSVATTYTAYEPSLGRYVSMVVVPPSDHDDASLRRQLPRQAELTAGLRHPNIVSVLDHGEHL